MMLEGKTAFVTGASRGIGLAIAKRLARAGCNVTVAAKTAQVNPKLSGTIYTAAKEIEACGGGKALPVVCDIRFEDQIQSAIQATVDKYGGIDILVNNASAIDLSPMENATIKKFDLMLNVNGRGTWLTTKLALPYLLKSANQKRNPMILMLSPPLDMQRHWFAPHVGYTMAKYNMSMIAHGLAGELDGRIGVNAIWPMNGVNTGITIDSEWTFVAAVANILTDGGAAMATTMKVEIMSDAAFAILSQDVAFNGNFCIDREVLRLQGIESFDYYKTDPRIPDKDSMPDFFVPQDINGKLPAGPMTKVLDVKYVEIVNSFARKAAKL